MSDLKSYKQIAKAANSVTFNSLPKYNKKKSISQIIY